MKNALKGKIFGFEKKKVVAVTVIAIGGILIVKKIGQSVGVIDSQGDKDRQNIQTNDYWNGNYWRQYKAAGKNFLLPDNTRAAAFCKKIYYANGVFSDADIDAIQAINEMPSLCYLSYISEYWENNFRSMFPLYPSFDNPSLVRYLEFMSDKSWTQLRQILSSKPKY